VQRQDLLDDGLAQRRRPIAGVGGFDPSPLPEVVEHALDRDPGDGELVRQRVPGPGILPERVEDELIQESE